MTTWQELYPNISLSIETITPAMCQEWLDKMPPNRKPRPKHVDALAEAIKRGEWKLNGEAFVVNRDGLLIDGRHRSLAVISCGKPIVSVVARGIDNDASISIDLGVTRTIRDHLTIQLVDVNASLLVAISTMYKLSQVKYGDPKEWTLNYKLSTLQASPAQAMRICDSVPHIHDMISKVSTHPHGLRGNMVAVALVYGLANEQYANTWLDQTNESMPKSIYDFTSGSRMHNLMRIAHLMNSINSFFDVEPIKIIWNGPMPPVPEEVKKLI